MTRNDVTSGLAKPGLMKAGLLPAIAAFAFALAHPGPAQAQDESGVFMKNLLGSLGIIEGEKDAIIYRERAPLVVPPSTNVLPPPRDGERLTANPAWPKDPDVTKAREAAAAARRPVPVRNDQMVSQGGRMSSQELLAVRGTGANSAPQPIANPCYGDNCRETHWVNPNQLRYSNGRNPDAPPIAYGQEPQRQALTEPPAGYRLPSPEAPIGKGQRAPATSAPEDGDPRGFINQEARRNR